MAEDHKPIYNMAVVIDFNISCQHAQALRICKTTQHFPCNLHVPAGCLHGKSFMAWNKGEGVLLSKAVSHNKSTKIRSNSRHSGICQHSTFFPGKVLLAWAENIKRDLGAQLFYTVHNSQYPGAHPALPSLSRSSHLQSKPRYSESSLPTMYALLKVDKCNS